MQQGETARILREKGNFLLLCWPFQKLLLFQEKWVGDLWLAFYLLQRANLELTRNECRLFWQRNETVKVYLADFIPFSTFVFEGRECFPTCGVFIYSYCTLKVATKFTLISLARHLVWNGLCMFVCMFSFFTSWYKILPQKKVPNFSKGLLLCEARVQRVLCFTGIAKPVVNPCSFFFPPRQVLWSSLTFAEQMGCHFTVVSNWQSLTNSLHASCLGKCGQWSLGEHFFLISNLLNSLCARWKVRVITC